MKRKFFTWLRRDKAGHERAEMAIRNADIAMDNSKEQMREDQERVIIFRKWRIENHLGEAWEAALRGRR